MMNSMKDRFTELGWHDAESRFPEHRQISYFQCHTILCHMRSYDTILYEIIWNGHIFRIIRHRHLAKHYLSKRSPSSSPKSSFASSLSLLPGRERPFQEVHSSSSQLYLQAGDLPPFFTVTVILSFTDFVLFLNRFKLNQSVHAGVFLHPDYFKLPALHLLTIVIDNTVLLIHH